MMDSEKQRFGKKGECKGGDNDGDKTVLNKNHLDI